MKAFTSPVSMVAGSGKSTALALGVVGLILMLVVASKKSNSTGQTTVKQAF